MSVPYDLTLSSGAHHELYGPWSVDAAADLIRSRRRAKRPLFVAASPVPCVDLYGIAIDPATVVAVAGRRGPIVPIEA
jgi:hypothetical protein